MNFDKIRPTIDVDAMQQRHVTIVGGAYGLARDLVRCGLGSITMVDFDRIDSTNPARQDLNHWDIGMYKVEAVTRDLRSINPEVEVDFLVRDFCELSRDEIEEHIGHSDLLIPATDFFPAQARGNTESLRLGIPAMWIGLYRAGRAGEIVYYIPGETPACYRCICSDRYAAHETGGTSVGSAGGTILDLHLVDAIAGQIAVGILTRGADNRMGRLIEKLGNRNLLQVKIDPDYRLGGKDIFGQYLGDHPANFSFTTIALPMERDENCPDCSPYQPPTPDTHDSVESSTDASARYSQDNEDWLSQFPGSIA